MHSRTFYCRMSKQQHAVEAYWERHKSSDCWLGLQGHCIHERRNDGLAMSLLSTGALGSVSMWNRMEDGQLFPYNNAEASTPTTQQFKHFVVCTLLYTTITTHPVIRTRIETGIG